MSNLSRWEPTSEFMTLRDAMDRLFDDAFTRPFARVRNGGSTWSSLPIDMYQTADDVVVKAVVPGFRPDQVQINVTGEVLTIRGGSPPIHRPGRAMMPRRSFKESRSRVTSSAGDSSRGSTSALPCVFAASSVAAQGIAWASIASRIIHGRLERRCKRRSAEPSGAAPLRTHARAHPHATKWPERGAVGDQSQGRAARDGTDARERRSR